MPLDPDGPSGASVTARCDCPRSRCRLRSESSPDANSRLPSSERHAGRARAPWTFCVLNDASVPRAPPQIRAPAGARGGVCHAQVARDAAPALRRARWCFAATEVAGRPPARSTGGIVNLCQSGATGRAIGYAAHDGSGPWPASSVALRTLRADHLPLLSGPQGIEATSKSGGARRRRDASTRVGRGPSTGTALTARAQEIGRAHV